MHPTPRTMLISLGASRAKRTRRNSAVVNDAVNPNLGAPKAITNFFIRHEFSEIQLTPAVQMASAKQTSDSIGLVFAVWPELRQGSGKSSIGILDGRRCAGHMW